MLRTVGRVVAGLGVATRVHHRALVARQTLRGEVAHELPERDHLQQPGSHLSVRSDEVQSHLPSTRQAQDKDS